MPSICRFRPQKPGGQSEQVDKGEEEGLNREYRYRGIRQRGEWQPAATHDLFRLEDEVKVAHTR